MKVTIIPEDQVVLIDDESTKIFFPTDTGIHAIQWDGERGTIEYKGKGAESFTNISVIQPYLDSVAEKKSEIASKVEPVVAEEKEAISRKTLVDLIISNQGELAKLKTALGLV